MNDLNDDATDGAHAVPVATHRTVRDEVVSLHLCKQDFHEGDLLHRLDRFDRYVLATVPVGEIDLYEFALDEQMVEEFAARFRATGVYPRIVFDAVDKSMIDGLHRANALAKCGLTEIDAYVGTRENLDPHWCPMGDDEDEDDDVAEIDSGDELSGDEVEFLRRVVRPR